MNEDVLSLDRQRRLLRMALFLGLIGTLVIMLLVSGVGTAPGP